MQAALQKVDGVEAVEVDFKSRTARVTRTDDCSDAELVTALKEAGFDGEVQH